MEWHTKSKLCKQQMMNFDGTTPAHHFHFHFDLASGIPITLTTSSTFMWDGRVFTGEQRVSDTHTSEDRLLSINNNSNFDECQHPTPITVCHFTPFSHESNALYFTPEWCLEFVAGRDRWMDGWIISAFTLNGNLISRLLLYRFHVFQSHFINAVLPLRHFTVYTFHSIPFVAASFERLVRARQFLSFFCPFAVSIMSDTSSFYYQHPAATTTSWPMLSVIPSNVDEIFFYYFFFSSFAYLERTLQHPQHFITLNIYCVRWQLLQILLLYNGACVIYSLFYLWFSR